MCQRRWAVDLPGGTTQRHLYTCYLFLVWIGRLGSGNNWACGYRNGSLAEEAILNSLRWQLEHADRVDTILPILSLAGGTGKKDLEAFWIMFATLVSCEGSGLGAYIVECVRDELPRSFLLTTIVVPYTSGEVVVQNYNSLLTLSHLYHSADALLVFENDILQQYAKKLVSCSGLDRPTNIHDMNNILTRHLCSFLQPVSQPSSSNCEINYLLESLLPHSFYKLLTLRCVPQLSDQALDFSTYKWSSLIKTLSQMYINNSYLDEGLNWSLKPWQTRTKSIANVFLARSYDKDEIEQDLKQYFDHAPFYSSSVSPSNSYTLFNSRDKSYLNYEKYLSFVSNCQTPVSALDRIVTKSWQLFGQKAYLHHYFKYDVDEQAFLNGFVQIEQVIKSYQQLWSETTMTLVRSIHTDVE